jgi:hypothetical protein
MADPCGRDKIHFKKTPLPCRAPDRLLMRGSLTNVGIFCDFLDHKSGPGWCIHVSTEPDNRDTTCTYRINVEKGKYRTPRSIGR